jgi:hypothetical protein
LQFRQPLENTSTQHTNATVALVKNGENDGFWFIATSLLREKTSQFERTLAILHAQARSKWLIRLSDSIFWHSFRLFRHNANLTHFTQVFLSFRGHDSPAESTQANIRNYFQSPQT